MSGLDKGETQQVIDQVKAYIDKNAPNNQIEVLKAFAQRYYIAAPFEDLKERAIKELYHIMLSQWDFMDKRAQTESKIRVFNPAEETDGWQSSHTVIQISHNDIPFLVDSIRMVINRYGWEIHMIIHFGGLKLKRDKKHHIVEILPFGTKDENAQSEAPIYIEIDRLANENDRNELKADLERVLLDVRAAVEDWRKMVGRIDECLKEMETSPKNLDAAEVEESRDFLRWLNNNNFTFLGARDYKLIGDGTNRALQVVPGSGLGVLRDDTTGVMSKSYSELPPQARKMALSNDILIIAKTNTIATIHREAYTDYIGVKQFNLEGELIGERRFIGLYTSTAYHSSPRQIPFLRHKVDKIIQDLGFPPTSHDGKEAVHILETLPRDDLFQATHEELMSMTMGIIQLKERRIVRLLVRRDAFYRYFSCLVFVPRDIFTTDLANTMQDVLMRAFKGLKANFTIYFSDSVLSRIHFLIRVNPKEQLEYNVAEIENELTAISRSWSDRLKDALIEHYSEAEGLRYYNKYNKAIPASYRECYQPTETINDINKINSLTHDNPLGMVISKGEDNRIRLKLFHTKQNIILSDVLPILENMGLRTIGEHPHELKFKNGDRIWINDFDLEYALKKEIDATNINHIFENAFIRIWSGEVENDGFNRLVLTANLTWQETVMLRAYTKYLRQTGFTFSPNYIELALFNNPIITKALVQLFNLRFDPNDSTNDRNEISTLITYIEAELDAVTSLDEDRILRRLLELIQATIRTNYFQVTEDNKSKSYLSFKFDPHAISDLPLPLPKFEIFVYSPQVEGVHLRAANVARGGLRWSDRREDFRTEVLGLMKAQQVKNTVIVPEGAKGGFVVKSVQALQMSRDDYLKEGISCYSIFICGLLDITDNIINGKLVPPVNVVRYDGDDPYLVVAADKGTATFSDTANKIAQRYGFWLDDAFASGGSAGYDHKKMGITSRGAWVSVERHFREIGINPALDDFTVVGIGDMAGDVFGNGMLLSRHIKLVAAFNHMHIFIDPNPDASVSFEERKRLFNLPRSGWSDYNPVLISPGGGVFSRSAKTIKLTPEINALLKTDKEAMVPNELIRAILSAKVDLIWNGGIGTFFKASTENHVDVGDRTNDTIRIDAIDLRSRVIAEGGNLGMTQLARIEYSLNGGVVNTDFIDNSAGVDCSDHEVNLKILFNRLVRDGILTREERNKTLQEMTDEVAALVLADNYEQTQMLSLETSVAHQTIDLFRYYMNYLEKQGRLDRNLEFLPSDAGLLERKANNMPLTRPEIAILLAYNKMYLKRDILSLDILHEPYFDRYLLSAFPKRMSEQYLPQLKEHSLRNEIIATQLCKAITDRMGINFVERLQRETGAPLEFIIRSYVTVQHIFDMETLWQQIIALDFKIRPETQYQMMIQIFLLIRRATRWMLRNRKPSLEIEKSIEDIAPAVNQLKQHIPALLDERDREAFTSVTTFLNEQGVPEPLAVNIARCNVLFTALDIVEASKKYDLDLLSVANVYFTIGNKLELNWLRESMNAYSVESQWDELARAGFRDDLDRVQRKIAVKILTARLKDTKDVNARIEFWINRQQFFIERWQKLLADIRSTDLIGFITYSVVLRELFDFVQAT